MADDDFLHELRARPSPVFATRLKAKLDRQNLRRSYAIVGCVAILAAGVAVAMAIPQVRHWLGAKAVHAHSSAETVVASATTSSSALPRSTPSTAAAPASPQITRTARPETQAVAGDAASSQADAATTKSQPSTAAGAVALSAPSLVGYVPAAISKLYAAWENAYPYFSPSTGRKMHLTLHPWQGDPHELPNDGVAAFVATSDSVTLDPVPGYTGFPLLVEGVVPIVHLDGINTADLVLDGSALAGIYLGEITVWNDPRIIRLNPNLNLPATPTLPVFHHGSVPSNAVFSGYLATSDPNFRNQVGVGATSVWPVGTGRGTDTEVAETVAGNNGSIGYVDFDFAREHRLPAPQLINAAGNATGASLPSIQAGANLVCHDLHFEQRPSQDPNAWPMSAISFALVALREPRAGHEPDAYETTNFFWWVLKNGGPIASGMNYVLLPDSIRQKLIARGLPLGSCL